MDGRAQVAYGPQALARVVDGEFGGEAFAQQPCAAAFGLVGRGAGGLGGVEFGQGATAEFGEGPVTCRGEVRESVVVGIDAEVDRGQRVEFGEGSDVGVRDAAGGVAAFVGVDQLFNHLDIFSQQAPIASLLRQT